MHSRLIEIVVFVSKAVPDSSAKGCYQQPFAGVSCATRTRGLRLANINSNQMSTIALPSLQSKKSNGP